MTQNGGSIVNVGSQSVRGLYRAPYAASKGGILALGKVLAMEYGRYGIRINTMSPGGTDIPDRVTSRLEIRPGIMAEEGAEAEAYRREMTGDIRNQQTLRRRGTAEDQAAAIAFLASEDASFVSGDLINCSGGQS
jgi:dihydroxycyclohexadiene carboxylate dehydrogenase